MNLKHTEAIIAAMPHLKRSLIADPDLVSLTGLQLRKQEKRSLMLKADHLRDDLEEKALLDSYYDLDY
jgi:hypothetical protein